jgi:uncharacterized delta-60 repeat protein
MWPFSSRTSRRSPSARVRPPRCRPRLEALEDRCLPSAGPLDPTFGSGGLVTTGVGTNGPNSKASAVIVQPDGKVVAGGSSIGSNGYADFTLVRYNANGTLDTTFGNNGVVQTVVGNDGGVLTGLALESDGKIVAVGNANNGGKVGKEAAVVRYNPNGSLDTTFGGGKHPSGIVLTQLNMPGSNGVAAVAIDGSGKIDLAAATAPTGGPDDFTLLRYNANGTLDTTFGPSKNGIVTTPVGTSASWATGLAVQPDGDIVLAGSAYTRSANNSLEETMGLARYTATGQLDTSFGSGGIVSNIVPPGSVWAGAGPVLVQGNGLIVVGGSASGPNNSSVSNLSLARFTSSGQLDTTFGNAGFAIDTAMWTANALALGANGDLLAAGGTQQVAGASSEDFGLAAFLPGGGLDTSFGTNGTATANFGAQPQQDRAGAMAIQGDGRIVLAGFTNPTGSVYEFALARFLPSQPLVGSFAASPNPVAAGSSLTLTASNLTDGNPNSSITQVAFYLDSNNDGTLEAGTDQVLGTATQTSPGVWTLSSPSAFGLATGSYTLFAQAQDSYGVLGNPLALTLTVQ